MRAMAVAIVAVCLFAGCTKPTSPPSSQTPQTSTSLPPSPTIIPPVNNRTVDLQGLRPELVNCLYFEIGFQAPKENLSEHLPQGYAPAGLSPATGSVNLNAYSCESVILTNETVIPEFEMVLTIVVVSVNDTLEQNSSFHYYALEIFVSNETMLKVLQALGYAARLADIQYSGDAQTVEVAVEVDGERWYRAQGGKGAGANSDNTLVEFVHQVGASERPQWIRHDHVFTLPAIPSPGMIEVSAGELDSIQPSDAGVVSATSREGPSRGQFGFGRLLP